MRSVISDTYLTIAAPAEGLYKDKGSRFLAFAYPIYSESDVKPIVEALKTKYYDARHHCYAWRLGIEASAGGVRFRANDDGEPAGTAGRPILGQLLSRELTNLLVVVVRYFGGIKLGVPGLIAAYKEATADALASAEVVERTENREMTVEFPYPAMNRVMKAVKDMEPRVLGQDFDLSCRMRLSVRLRDAAALAERIGDIEGVNVSLS
ncbi:IMPACT family protein [Rikenella microfusus]|uniref:IMPACT family member yigZ n=1 Tax=Rikenella microfusus TaxID=28139 RepID=A0A379MU77_9BACT|nr:YigZ family protein [Rikenella microfusus]SUE34407.1 IMPACT family member yigZ [Rikenella microfusus]HJE88064.1 YigZ family protein [Rikenella microfusus]